MAYGSAFIDTITSSGNLSVTGNIVPSGGIYAPNTPGRNRIINGSMNIDQRNNGSSQTITAAAVLAYTVDRWYAYCTGANVTGQRVTNTGVSATSPSQYAYQFTGAASVTAIGFAQRIEAVNCFDLANTTATLSVNLSNSALTTVTWTAYYATTTDTFGTLASPTRTQIATGTFTVTSTITRYNTQISIPSAATTGIEIVFTVGAQTSGTWVIGNVQLEAGSMMSVYERRLVTQELSLCQRYYYKAVGNDSSPGTAFSNGGYSYSATNAAQSLIPFPTTMRANPTSTRSGIALAQLAGNWAVTSIAATTSSTTQGSLSFQIGSSSLTTGQNVMVYSTGAGGYIDFSAEL